MHLEAQRMQIAIIGADIRPSVTFIEHFGCSGTWNETGLMTKHVETRKRTRVAMEYPSIVGMAGVEMRCRLEESGTAK